MKSTSAVFATLLLSIAVSAAAQQQGTIQYQPVACIRADDMPVLHCGVKEKGELRAYFRRVGATDWCTVPGENRGQLSAVTLPKFLTGEEIEYYFVVINGKQIVAKTADIYRVKATEACDNPVARHATILPMECLPPGANPIGRSIGAGYAMSSSSNETPAPQASPDRP
jgi:hypothetical protein